MFEYLIYCVGIGIGAGVGYRIGYWKQEQNKMKFYCTEDGCLGVVTKNMADRAIWECNECGAVIDDSLLYPDLGDCPPFKIQKERDYTVTPMERETEPFLDLGDMPKNKIEEFEKKLNDLETRLINLQRSINEIFEIMKSFDSKLDSKH